MHYKKLLLMLFIGLASNQRALGCSPKVVVSSVRNNPGEVVLLILAATAAYTNWAEQSENRQRRLRRDSAYRNRASNGNSTQEWTARRRDDRRSRLECMRRTGLEPIKETPEDAETDPA